MSVSYAQVGQANLTFKQFNGAVSMDINGTTLDVVTNDTNSTGSSEEDVENVFDIVSDKTFRLLILYLTIGLNAVGTTLVLIYMLCNRRKGRHRFTTLTRVNAFILNLTVADALVILIAVTPQLIWEYVDREWGAGPIMCRTVKFLQSFAIMSSNYILIVIAVDRHRAVRSPLKGSLSVWLMAGTGWALAVLFSLPVFGMYKLNLREGRTYCDSILRDKPLWHRQIWMTYIAIVVFFIPLLMLVVCYTRIFMKISGKVTQNSLRLKSRHVTQCTQSYSLPKAKTKTLKMTFVIIAVFVFCTLPFFTIEMIMSFGDFSILSPKLYALIGGMAAFNSAMNPFVFLAFNIKLSMFADYGACCQTERTVQNRTMSLPTSNSTAVSSVHSMRHTKVIKQGTRESLVEMKPLKTRNGDLNDKGTDLV